MGGHLEGRWIMIFLILGDAVALHEFSRLVLFVLLNFESILEILDECFRSSTSFSLNDFV